jgi:hypothetical protein
MTSRKAISQIGRSRCLEPYMKQTCYIHYGAAFITTAVRTQEIKCNEICCAIYPSVGRQLLIHEEWF